MSFIPGKCPSCGEEIQLDDQCHTCFCSYCGSKVVTEKAVQNKRFQEKRLTDGISAIEKQLKNAETYYKIGDNEKEEEILKKITEDFAEDYRAWLRLAIRFIDGHKSCGGSRNYINENESPIFFFGKCYLPHTDDCVDDYFGLLENTNIKYALILSPENEAIEMKHQLSELGKPLLTYLLAEKEALIISHKYFQESVEVRDRAIKIFGNKRKELPRTFFLKKKEPVSLYDLWEQCLENELKRSTINRDIYDSYWIYPTDHRYHQWKDDGNYGEFYKMYFRDCNSNYCSIDVGIRRNEDNLIAISKIINEYDE